MISSFQLLLKNQSTKIMQINSTVNWLLKPLTDQPPLKLKESYSLKELNSCPMFFVMLVVLLSVTSNGSRIWITSDGEDFWENGSKNQRTTSCQSLKKQLTLTQKKFTMLQRNCCQVPQKETSFTPVWKKSCQVPLTKSLRLLKLEN